MVNLTATTIQRQRLLVQGLVQGVGFRPFIYGLALRLGLDGFVLNDSEGVTIEIEGSPGQLAAFHSALRAELPPLARVDSLVTEMIAACYESGFKIVHSQAGGEKHALISPDSATCPDCLRELFDPADRRYRYPFINCTNCGPRFTIVKDVPYDRDQTTMAVFPMCPACRAEYEDPLNRRFHAQPNACPVCGPKVRLLAGDGQALEVADPIEAAARQLAAGSILAVKGLGGYHLACDALNEAAVARLRSRKHREAKPFALMVATLETARQLCEVNEAEEKLLRERQRPIVLLRQRPGAGLAPTVAPNYPTLGLMLPYTPLHYLLLDAFGRAVGKDRPAALVMTSGNMSDEPIAYRDGDAAARLAPVAEGWLTHDREIHMRCDDSVARVLNGSPQFFRRSRGYAPEPLRMSRAFPRPVLACGGHLKNTFCLAKERQAFVSHHIGDLENLETLTSFREGIEHYRRLFDIAPQAVAYDLHPDYLATRYALDLDLPYKIGVQHHHAHIASVLAEHGLTGPVIGVAADGTGYGGDGTIWGCEIMLASLLNFERLAHLAYIPLPGGDRAVRQPWRVAASLLAQVYGENFLDLDLDVPFTRQLDPARWKPLARMITGGVNSPLASSLGRLFDGVSALVGLRQEVVYEGQAAIELENIALPADRVYPFEIQEGTPQILDVGPLLRAIVAELKEGVPAGVIAGRFHRSIAELLAAVCRLARARTGLNEVALSGGVFQNRLLLEQLVSLLEEAHFTVYRNRQVPPNDGGLSLGQAAVAAARLET